MERSQFVKKQQIGIRFIKINKVNSSNRRKTVTNFNERNIQTFSNTIKTIIKNVKLAFRRYSDKMIDCQLNTHDILVNMSVAFINIVEKIRMTMVLICKFNSVLSHYFKTET